MTGVSKVFLWGGVPLIVAALFFVLHKVTTQTIVIKQHEAASVVSPNPALHSLPKGTREIGASPNPLTGVSCDVFGRPFAVMLAEDVEARPLSGIGSANVVIEMPVVTGSVTRLMAIFSCEAPEEIGSVRSARHDFIPLAQGYDAIFAHWGGSSYALDLLQKGEVDNLDALPNPFDVFYRENWIPAPHNGFTSLERMKNAARRLGYRKEWKFPGYFFLTESTFGGLKKQKVSINYTDPYNVEYIYDPVMQVYARWRGGVEELDKLTKKQVKVKNVAVMRAKSRQIGGGYNDVDILGTGYAIVFRRGEAIEGRWEKKEARDVLRLYNKDNEEIAFAPGKIWIEVVEPDTVVQYDE